MMTKTLVSSLAAVVGAAALIAYGDEIRVPYRLDDVLRTIVLIQATFGLGLIGSIVHSISQFDLHDKDRVIRPLRFVALSHVLGTLYIGFDVLSRIGVGFLSWRTPLAIIVFATSSLGLLTLTRRVREIGKKMQDGSKVKPTLSVKATTIHEEQTL
jgi:hypothetical protein